MSITTLPVATHHEVYVQNSVSLVAQCQHHAVRTALSQIVDGTPSLALSTLIASVRRCAHLDNRPLSPERVVARANQLVREWRDAA